MLKLDSSGSVEWQKTYGGDDWDKANSVLQAGDGAYVVAGRTESFGAGSKDFWVMKLDQNGELEECSIGRDSNAIISETNAVGIDSDSSAQDTFAIMKDYEPTITTAEYSEDLLCFSQSDRYNLAVSIYPEKGGTVTGPGITCPGDCRESYGESPDITLTATPSEGFSFTGWTGDCAECQSESCTIIMDSGKTCTATFERVSETKVGDVNGDGDINIVDALLVARYAVQLPVSNFDEDAADVNCDGHINIVDALLIARKAVGLSVTDWCGE